jgi:hypothetical protein
MSFRERTGQQPSWDPNDDPAPPVWSDRSPLTSGGQPESGLAPGLPAWDADATANDESQIPLPPLPRRGERGRATSSDRRPSSWPNLRDSLKGTGSGVTSSRTSRRSATSAPYPSRRRDDEGHMPGPDLFVGDVTTAAPSDENDYLDGAETFDEPRYPPRHGYSGRSRQRSRRSGAAAPRPSLHIPPLISALAASQDRLVLAALGGTVLSLLMMAATLSTRTDALPSWIAIHLNAAGNADQWGTPSTLWRLPLATAMLSVASLITAAFLARRDPFAARFLVAGSLLVHVLAWLGLIRLLW